VQYYDDVAITRNGDDADNGAGDGEPEDCRLANSALHHQMR